MGEQNGETLTGGWRRFTFGVSMVGAKRTIARSGLTMRLIGFVIVPLALFASLIAFFLFAKLERWAEEKMQEDVELVARALQAPLGYALERERHGTIEHALESAFDIGRLYAAFIYDERGELIRATGQAIQAEAGTIALPVDFDAEGQSGKYGEIEGRAVFSYFVPLQDEEGALIGLLQVSRLHRDMLEELRRLRLVGIGLVIGGIGASALIIVAGYQRAAGRSFEKLHKAMHGVKAGSKDSRIPPEGPREIAALTDSFNDMMDALEDAERELHRQSLRERALFEKLQVTGKLAAIGQVAGGVAHELGTPLSVVDGTAQRALRRSDLSEAGRRSFQEVRAEVSRMSSIVRQLLDFGRASASGVREVPVGVLLNAALQESEQAAASRNCTVRIESDGDDLYVQGDPLRLELAIRNLLRNACQAARSRVTVRCEARAGKVVLSFIDDGPGIPPTVRDRIFSPFFTTRSDGGGTGLGLAIVQQVADESNGSVELIDRDEGACFVLILPGRGGRASRREECQATA